LLNNYKAEKKKKKNKLSSSYFIAPLCFSAKHASWNNSNQHIDQCTRRDEPSDKFRISNPS